MNQRVLFEVKISREQQFNIKREITNKIDDDGYSPITATAMRIHSCADDTGHCRSSLLAYCVHDVDGSLSCNDEDDPNAALSIAFRLAEAALMVVPTGRNGYKCMSPWRQPKVAKATGVGLRHAEEYVHGCVPNWGRERTVRSVAAVEHKLTWTPCFRPCHGNGAGFRFEFFLPGVCDSRLLLEG